jgi:hypothetical protein
MRPKATDLLAFPSMLIPGERAFQFSWFDAFYADVLKRWALFNKVDASLSEGRPGLLDWRNIPK